MGSSIEGSITYGLSAFEGESCSRLPKEVVQTHKGFKSPRDSYIRQGNLVIEIMISTTMLSRQRNRALLLKAEIV